jgi:hypothetical protein
MPVPVFPEDLWAARGIPAGFDADAAPAELLPLLDQRFGAPRNLGLAERFCRDEIPAGRIFVYGAGNHTRALLPALRRRTGLTILGIVDRMAATLKQFEGLEVVAPERLARRAFDYILLSHGQYEVEMRDRLREAGIDDGKIVPIYLSRSFRALASGALSSRVAGRGCEHVIVSTSRDSVIGDRALASLFPPDRTLNLFMGRPDAWPPGGLYEAIDLEESLDALCAAIETLAPRTIYLRPVIYKNFYGMVLQHRFPQIRVIHEFYDLALTWRDEDLAALFGLNARTIRDLRVAELYSVRHAAAVVSKRGGEYWASVLGRCTAPYELYFPMIERAPAGSAPAPRDPDGKIRLLYAGFLPSARFLAQFRHGYRFLDLMERLAATGRIEIDIYNSTHHDDPGADETYRDYLARFASGPIRYHRRVDFAALTRRMADYDFGWLCEDIDVFQPDRYFGICNRWTGYVMGGLPALMDDSWKFVGGLVADNQAGIVLDGIEPERIMEALAGSASTDFRSGVARLRDRLADINEAALDRLSRIVDRA